MEIIVLLILGFGILCSFWRMEMIFRKILDELKQHNLKGTK